MLDLGTYPEPSEYHGFASLHNNDADRRDEHPTTFWLAVTCENADARFYELQVRYFGPRSMYERRSATLSVIITRVNSPPSQTLGAGEPSSQSRLESLTEREKYVRGKLQTSQ